VLAEKAAKSLGSAGQRAYARRDVRTTVDLLERASRLLPGRSTQRLRFLPDLAEALLEVGERERAHELLEQGLATAETLGDRGLRAHMLLALRAQSEEGTWPELAERDARDALQTFEALQDEAGMALAWKLLGDANWQRMKVTATSAAWERALEHSSKAGLLADAARQRAWLLIAVLFGPRPAAECLELAEAELPRVADFPSAMGVVLWTISNARAMLGDVDGAGQALDASRAMHRELGREAWSVHFETQVEEENAWYAGDITKRIAILREGVERFERVMGEKNILLSAALAVVLAQDGDVEAAEPYGVLARDSAEGGLPFIRVEWQQALALCAAHRGEAAEAEALIDDAIASLRNGEFVVELADALLVQAEVLRHIARRDRALAAAQEAMALYEAKGVVGLVARSRALIDDLRTSGGAKPGR
jgi:tetratricopeptide (TPR) repeat protein